MYTLGGGGTDTASRASCHMKGDMGDETVERDWHVSGVACVITMLPSADYAADIPHDVWSSSVE